MITCFILLNVEAGKEMDVYNALMKCSEVEGIREVFGQYDLIARVESRNLNELRKIIINKVRSIPGVLATTTLVTTE
ncbi:MAG: Lrp/AsnC ligand binding domain-containing protein [Euryarchaeota archaeon]|nr:Lrp/AsnC ligand binding domain-containing protein [Euryarchaeota archaeon]